VNKLQLSARIHNLTSLEAYIDIVGLSQIQIITHGMFHAAKPFHLPPLDPDDRAGSMRRNADEVMCRMAAMLPPAYRGEYANHPRLAEFLEDG
jgi:hypothetical protein